MAAAGAFCVTVEYRALVADITFSGANSVIRHCSRGVYSHYAVPRATALAEIGGFAELRVSQ